MIIDWSDPRNTGAAPAISDMQTITVSSAPPIDWQAAILEGMEIMREAAAEAFEIPDGEQWDDCCIDTLYDYECAILNLDPAAILEAHTRAKATP